MTFVSIGNDYIDYPNCRLDLGDALDKAVQFADTLFRSESKVLQSQGEICAELSGSCSRRTGGWMEKISF